MEAFTRWDEVGMSGRQLLGEENLISWVVLARLRTHLRFAWTLLFCRKVVLQLGVGMVKAGTFLLCDTFAFCSFHWTW